MVHTVNSVKQLINLDSLRKLREEFVSNISKYLAAT